MSRIGSNPVEVPTGVELRIEGQQVSAKGKLGELSLTVDPEIEVLRDDGAVAVKLRGKSKHARNMWGTTRTLIHNLITGVSEGYTYKLELVGVGYRAEVQGENLQLLLGFSHPVIYPIPDGISIQCEKPTAIAITGMSKQRVGQVAADIRAYRPPEPYKGKGVRYENEYVRRKEGKKK